MVATGYFFHTWAEESIPVVSFEPAGNEIVLSTPARVSASRTA